MRAASCATLVLTALAVGCSGRPAGTPESPGRENLLAVTRPDLSGTDQSVREQAGRAYASLAERLRLGAGDAELSAAYGAYGMVLQAAEYYDAAEPNLLNAQRLAPGEIRWPYYLGHLYQTRGDLTRAKAAFGRSLEIRPGDLAALIWLGRVHLDEAGVDEAEALFRRASTIAPDAIAVLAGLGRVALARRDDKAAVAHLERALGVDAEAAESLHAPLAVAYRRIGDSVRAERHERQWANRDILVPDPLSQELDMLLDNGLSNELRGVRALEASDWVSAAAYFRRGLEVTPGNSPLRRSLQHKLGTALYLGGGPEAAAEEFEQVVAAAPATGLDESVAKAHYSLAVIEMARARYAAAVAHFEGAVKFKPTYQEARLGLAETLRRTGQVAASVRHYEEALALEPGLAQASMGHALALIRLGRFLEARDRLNVAVATHRDRPEFLHMLSRLLAVAPDDRVRDGRRALELVENLLEGGRTTELGETLAMALAEVGDYDRAASIQRAILAVVRRGGSPDAAQRLERNLRLYETRRPTRTFWESDGLTPPS